MTLSSLRKEDGHVQFILLVRLTLLDWKRAAQSPPGMMAFQEGERPWSGTTNAEGVRTGWLPYVQVDDVDAVAEQAVKLGAQIVKERTRGPAGDFIVIEDPARGVLALWTSV